MPTARLHHALLEEQHSIALDLRNGEADFVGINQQFEQLGNDVLAVFQLGLLHELGEAGDVGNEE